MSLKIDKDWFIDEDGRKVLLRGVNLGGSSKVPFKPNGATHIKTDFSDHRDVSFIGRPFPLKEANEHFSRLKHWGFNCLRFLITWEAIEHKGPKQYDNEYLDYIEEVLKMASEFDFYTYIDPHQDVWSRMSGGDGAPGWTFEKVGLDFTKFDASEAALVMQYRYDPNNPNTFPIMHWPSNAVRFANSTMWTIFFGGKDFAPSCKIKGLNAQDYLQQHYYNAFKQVALRVKDNPYVIGFDSLNEPEPGWIQKRVDGVGSEKLSEDLGYTFTPFDAMLTGSGYTRAVGFKEVKRFGVKETRKDDLNEGKVSCWLEGAEDIWRKEGVWGLDESKNPIILNNEYFVVKEGKIVDFNQDYLSPFILKYTKTIREVIPNSIIFFESQAIRILRGERLTFNVPENVVHAGHWYDGATLGTKRPMIKASYDISEDKIVMGKKNIQEMFNRQLNNIKSIAQSIHGGIPTLIGEFGLPYDLNNKEAYQKFKSEPNIAWEKHIKLLTMYYNALDANLLHSTQWNYTADNTNEWGDQWNLEDLSIFSKSQVVNPKDINSGGRAIKGFCRPHFIRCAGIPLKTEFNIKTGSFYLEFDGETSIKESTLIYVPKVHYPNGFEVKVSEGKILKEENKQVIKIKIQENGVHIVNISRIN
ncbi:MAG: cellulase family glycosylhydrolase [Candidatus Heimdallarchaeota archaeon]